MKIIPVNSPHAITTAQTTGGNPDARARAIAKLAAPAQEAKPQAQETPVADPNNVSPEELSAIQPSTQQEVDTAAPIEAKEETQAPEIKEEKPDPKLVERFNQLARQERQLRAKAQQQDQALKQREAALAAKEQELAAKDAQYRQDYVPKSRIKQDALSVLDEAGVSYDEVTQQAITRQPTDPRVTATISRLEAKIQELENKAASSQKTYQDQQQDNYKAAVQQITRDVKQLVQTDPEFETIKATNSTRDVVDLIEKTFQKTGEVLTVEEAAKEVEDYLVEEALKLTQVGKIKQRMSQNSANSKTSQQQKQAPTQQTQMKTLTNATASTRKLSSKERAILAFKGELKS